MACPPGLRAQQNGVDALRLGTLEDFSVWYFVLPPDAKQGPQTSHVEGVELFGMPAVDSPCNNNNSSNNNNNNNNNNNSEMFI